MCIRMQKSQSSTITSTSSSAPGAGGEGTEAGEEAGTSTARPSAVKETEAAAASALRDTRLRYETRAPEAKTGPSPPVATGPHHAVLGSMDVNEQSMKLKLQNSQVCDSDEELDREDEMEAEYREAQQQQPPDD